VRHELVVICFVVARCGVINSPEGPPMSQPSGVAGTQGEVSSKYS
jgi:hypothetical protein